MTARIYQQAKNAMQSGLANTDEWILEHEAESGREIDPLMGWTSSRDTRAQVRLTFATRDEAIAYAERNGLPYSVLEPTPRRAIRKSYADNFKYGRKDSWTH
jgi:hypothetical protein